MAVSRFFWPEFLARPEFFPALGSRRTKIQKRPFFVTLIRELGYDQNNVCL
jgi:hypothetical protein